MKICILSLWLEFGTRPKTQVSPDCDLSHKSRSRVPCTEGGPGQSQANVPTNHENAWALDLCFGILPRGTAKKLLKSLVAPVGPQTTRAESKGNESALDSLFSLDTTNRQNARRGLFWPQYPHGGLLGFVGTQAGGPPPDSSETFTIAIWLILPVVIRSSQRLSHACLSISTLYCETANGSLYQL